MTDTIRLWKIWWLGGIAVVTAMIGLSIAGDEAWLAGSPQLAALLALARLVVYWLWFMAAWKCSRNVGHRIWTPAARVSLVAGLIATALT